MEMKGVETVDAYLDQFEGETKAKLCDFRKLILNTVPEAVESMSYGMPAYKFNKKPLAYFAGFKNHIGFYATPNTHESFQSELKRYKQGKGSVQFPLNEPLPLDLIEQMLLFRKEGLLAKK